MNKTFCVYPFVHSHVSATYDRKLCCIAPALPEEHKKTTDEFWNSDYVKQTRLDMIEGKHISGCEYCYNFEKSGGWSLRKQLNEKYDINHLIENTEHDGYLNLKPNFYDVRSTVCNLQCVTCDENHSSTHKKLSVKLGTSKNNHRIDSEYETKIANEIVEGLESKRVKMLYWSGGEPMIMKMHWIVIEKMLELLGLPDYHDYIKSIELCYNTNLSKLYYKNHFIPEVLSKFDTLIWASLDGVKETHNYCRDGSNWENVYSNWLEYKKYIPKLGVTSVLSAPVLMDIDRYIRFLEAEQCMFFDHEFLPTGYNELLDIKLYPKELFDNIISYANSKLHNSNLDRQSVHNSITILNKYVSERQETILDYSKIKQTIDNRDIFNKGDMSFEALLKVLHNESYDWYKSIQQ